MNCMAADIRSRPDFHHGIARWAASFLKPAHLLLDQLHSEPIAAGLGRSGDRHLELSRATPIQAGQHGAQTVVDDTRSRLGVKPVVREAYRIGVRTLQMRTR